MLNNSLIVVTRCLFEWWSVPIVRLVPQLVLPRFLQRAWHSCGSKWQSYAGATSEQCPSKLAGVCTSVERKLFG